MNIVNKNIRQSFGKLCEVRKGKFYRGKIAYMHFINFFSYKDVRGNETRVPARNEFIPCVTSTPGPSVVQKMCVVESELLDISPDEVGKE